MKNLAYSVGYVGNNIPPYSSGYGISDLQETGTIICVTDPSGADIYVDEVLQPVKTSTSITVPAGNRTITFVKAGYGSYSEKVAGLRKGQVVSVCAILGQTVSIINSSIVICFGPAISTCPITPLDCLTQTTPLNYVNMVAIINSTVQTSLTVTFTYTLNGIAYYDNVSVNLSIGTNIVYAWPINRTYPTNTTLTLTGVALTLQPSGEGRE